MQSSTQLNIDRDAMLATLNSSLIKIRQELETEKTRASAERELYQNRIGILENKIEGLTSQMTIFADACSRLESIISSLTRENTRLAQLNEVNRTNQLEQHELTQRAEQIAYASNLRHQHVISAGGKLIDNVIQEQTTSYLATRENLDQIQNLNTMPQDVELSEYLVNKLMGLQVTGQTQALMAVHAREYFSKRTKIPLAQQNEFMASAMELAMTRLLSRRIRFDPQQIAVYNDNIQYKSGYSIRFFGVTYRIPYFTTNINSGNEMGTTCTVVHTSSLVKALGLALSITIAGLGSYIFIRRGLIPMGSTIIHKTQSLLERVWRIGTNLLSSRSIIQDTSPLLNICESLDVHPVNIPMMSTLSLYPIPQSEHSIPELYKDCSPVNVLSHIFPLLSKLRNYQPESIRLQGLSRLGTQPLMLNTGCTLSQSKRLLSNAYNLVKEHTIMSQERLPNLQRDIDTFMSAITHRLTHMSPLRCYASLTDFIKRAFLTIRSWHHYVVERSTIRHSQLMATNTNFGEHACLETLIQASEIASSTTIFFSEYWMDWVSEVRLLLTGMIQSSSLTIQSTLCSFLRWLANLIRSQ